MLFWFWILQLLSYNWDFYLEGVVGSKAFSALEFVIRLADAIDINFLVEFEIFLRVVSDSVEKTWFIHFSCTFDSFHVII